MKLRSITTGKFTIPCVVEKISALRAYFKLPCVRVRYVVTGLTGIITFRRCWVNTEDIGAGDIRALKDEE